MKQSTADMPKLGIFISQLDTLPDWKLSLPQKGMASRIIKACQAMAAQLGTAARFA
jgi:hypothetical protein